MRLIIMLLLLTTTSTFSQFYSLTVFERDYQELVFPLVISEEFEPGASYGINLQGDTIRLFDTRFDLESPSPLIVMSDGVVSGFNFQENKAFFIYGSQGQFRSRSNDSSRISMIIEGEPGTGIFKIEYRNLALIDKPDSLYLNFQVWLYQIDQSIEIRIGENNLEDIPNELSIGIWFTELSMNQVGEVYEIALLKGDPQNPETVYEEQDVALDKYPGAGTVYRFSRNISSVMFTDRGQLELYPNPTDDFLKINSQDQIKSLKIYDMRSNLVKISNNNDHLDVSELETGVYHITCETVDGIIRGKFIKR